MTRTGPTPDDLQAARNQDPVEARMANATLGAERSAVSAAKDAKDAATGSARATESVARAAAATSTQAADGTADAGRDVSPTEPDPR